MTTPGSTPELQALQTALRGQYAVERELGRGGMGIVFLARDIALDRPVAIKLLPPTLATPAQRERFLQEARTAARLAHPHIVPIHAVEQRGELVFIVMGYIAGTTLAERVRAQGPLDPATATRVMQEVAWALAHAHQHGVVHRDIKPENILLERGTGRAVVTDFGIARRADADSSGPQRVVGTARFMSPEQAAGAPVDGRSDLYSLGVTAFYALTGRVPFDAAELPQLLVQQETLPVPPVAALRAGLPPVLAAAIDRCLARTPDERFASAADLADALAAVHDSSATPATLHRIAREVSAFAVDLAGYGTLAAVAIIVELIKGGDFFGMRRVYTLTVSLVLIALTALRGMLLSRLVGEAVAEGWDEHDLVAAIEREARRRAATTELPRPGRLTGTVIFLAGLAALLAYWLGPKELGLNTLEGPIAWAIELIGLIAPVAWGRWYGARLEAPYDGRPGLFSRFVAKVKLKGLFWLGRLTRSAPPRASGIADNPTEVVIAAAARDILRALPDPDRRLEGAGQLLARLESEAAGLRQRLRELDEVRAGMGSGASPRHHELARDLDAARRTATERLGTTVSALENLRLDLLRIRAGLAQQDGLTAELDALRDLSARVDAQLDLGE